MPSFAGQFFPPDSGADGGGGGSSADAGAPPNSYCAYKDPLLSLSGSIIYLSSLPALAVAARATHALGRLPTMWAIAALLAGGAAAGAAAQDVAIVFVSRCLLGMAMGCSFQAPTILLSEVLPRHKRGVGLYAYNLAMLLGFLLSAAANQLLRAPTWGWRASLALQAAPAAVLVALLPTLSESPQALLQRGRKEDAERALRAVRPAGADVTEELAQMVEAAARGGAVGSAGKPQHQRGPRALLSRRNLPELTASLLYPTVLMLAGLNVLSTWAPNLLVALGAGRDAALAGNTAMMAAGLAAAALGALVVERVGRRTLLAAGGAVIAVSMALLAVLLAVYLPAGAPAGGSSPTLLAVAMVLLCINRIALSCTLQPLASTVPAEVQPLQIRSKLSSVTAGTRNGVSFFVTQFALPLLCATRWGLFLIFACCTAAGVAALWLLVPETRGLPLERVHLAWAGHWFWGRFAGVRARLGMEVEGMEEGQGKGGPAAVAAAAAPAAAVACAAEQTQRGELACGGMQDAAADAAAPARPSAAPGCCIVIGCNGIVQKTP